MQRVCNAETAHVANWYRYSPGSPLVELTDEAIDLAGQEWNGNGGCTEGGTLDDEIEALNRSHWGDLPSFVDELAELISDDFISRLPSHDYFDEGLGVNFADKPGDYESGSYLDDPLMSPLLGEICDRICFATVAEILLESQPQQQPSYEASIN